jgi:hypothetical protein
LKYIYVYVFEDADKKARSFGQLDRAKMLYGKSFAVTCDWFINLNV